MTRTSSKLSMHDSKTMVDNELGRIWIRESYRGDVRGWWIDIQLKEKCIFGFFQGHWKVDRSPSGREEL